ncbi:hypothetical protein B4U79_06594 [Dinothrombium tinctorium]|uniref:28S ribosomal protein S27, mitochondrial n=1 Tax=Dinothrombium tinctorium TaxID=1965070 RepID=A0A3S3P7F5_9ACAR|nr:hypothetical protein B4U79_08498 [Dinothrombium tinctorium]RWS13901.1 hypothetical protein B4U79_06594 [Dinothrombium tinctorium]
MNFLTLKKVFIHSLKAVKNVNTVRTLLSSAYSCEDAWRKRTESGLLSKVDTDKIFTEINMRYTRKLKVGAVDIDIYANTIESIEQLEDCKHVLQKFRKTRHTKDALESTHHAVIRAFLKHNKLEEIVEILENRIDFGIFADDVCYNLLFDRLIEQKDFRNASRVAISRMLQEDFENTISNIFSLYAIYSYLNDENRAPLYAHEVEKEEPEEDDDEPTYVRVPYLRNPFFDDHFDIKNGLHLCGKTLYLVGKRFDDIVGRSSQLLGLCLYNKWEKVENLLKQMDAKFASDMFSKSIVKYVSRITESLEEDEKQKCTKFLDTLKSFEQRASNEDIYTLVCNKLSEIERHEQKDIESIVKSFEEWEKRREDALNTQMFELMREEKLKEINAKIAEIKEKERRLFFFENIDKHEMEFAEAEKQLEAVKSTSTVDEDYVPPMLKR